ncbi:DUF309 domain-containing protein [Pseudodonghicola flavimaris]|uniref:DUF309 domain-containing protein n=1 Tax=Pseudodonghicola flavimaris TaxID=3050036 RepID=A0ABT7EWZ8_9RHOB|nr:DUF309 domain-containing protein [Pseudodonghicola flavimaris]MDK3016862.1 DUF309 domain-containing protein [Pseudodonghicola flavimaris]
MSVADLAASAAWCGGWRFLDAGYCWEAHELFEPVWMALPQNSRARVFAQGVIQVANAGLKARMGRPAAVTRIAARAHAHLAEAGPEGAAAMGIAPGRAEALLQASRFYMHNSAQ